MNVISHPANDDGLAIQFGEDAAAITMQFVAQRFIPEERTAVFGGENSMDQDLSERLGHEMMMSEWPTGFNSFRVGGILDSVTQRRPMAIGQRWAE